MTIVQTDRAAAARASASFIWERQARPVMDAIAFDSHFGPARAVVMGNAGSGKSTVIRELHRLLSDHSAGATVLTDRSDVARVPRSHVLLVDDLHLLDAGQIDALRARSDDPASSLVVASRPWPRIDALSGITRSLERSRPAIVLGHVSRSDVLTYLDGDGRGIPDPCVDDILAFTGGVSWLVSEALALHDGRDCADGSGHRHLMRDIEERIAHRLDTIPVGLRHQIEVLCVAGTSPARPLADPDDVIAQAYAEGLLMRNGQPVPLVRSAVRATIPPTRLIELSVNVADGIAHSAADGDAGYREWLGGIHDRGVADALVEQGDRMLDRDPRRALDLYDAARDCGSDPRAVAARRAHAAWASGDADLAGAIIDELPPDAGADDSDRIADTSAAVWSLRGMMRMSAAVYRSLPPTGPDSCTRALIAAVGAGGPVPDDAAAPIGGLPSTLGVAMELLGRGLRTTLIPGRAEAAVADLVRASQMYTASSTSAPIPELPAVIAAIVAMNVGDLDIAHAVVEEAIRGEQGGEWASTRLLLWRAWIAVQRSRPLEAREALEHALTSSPTRSCRDHLLAQAVRVAIARRYEDAASLESTWSDVRDCVLHVEADLFVLLPLAELMTSAARVGDTARLEPHFARAMEIVAGLGSPPIWSAHLSWAGIQQGILLNRPDDLKPHARALVAASAHSPVAAVMAQAGRVWTATLAGSVDADAVEAAAHGLASAGLSWDGARLAGHGASRSTDRKVSARLLSCARELHPGEGVRRTTRAEDDGGAPAAGAADGSALSERELDVARLVLQGKTYAEIGETIFISPRTAEHHIAHMRRRLGATSRSDLIAKLRVVVDQSARGGDRVADAEGRAAGSP
jgi:DNA-binding CsgD family transcriptional regulator/energy-coupling factor transporter ATP-binding protein EcfA2